MPSLSIYPSGPLQGTLEMPGDKSLSHRAVIFGSVARGTTQIEHLLEAEDVLCTLEAMRRLGVEIKKTESGKWRVTGRGIEGLKNPTGELYCGNSGTTLRLLTGLLVGLPVTATLTGDASLNQRPMGRVIEPLLQMGAKIEEKRAPGARWITVFGGSLRGRSFKIPVASAQLKSAILLAGLSSHQRVSVREPVKSRDHSERMLKAFGADLRVNGFTVSLRPGRSLKSQRIVIPGDFSSAAFFLVAGLISPHPQTRVTIRNVGINPTRTGALGILKRMGGKIRVLNRRTVCGEPVGDLVVRSSFLRGTTIAGKIIPSLIDEIPILSIAAAAAEGKTIVQDAEELRIKETDRIHALATELPKFGVTVREQPDGLEIFGLRDRKGLSLQGAQGKSAGDHRMAMSLAILGTIAEGVTLIEDTDCISTSFPTFVDLLKKVGGKISH